jgi:hypothetical protein
MAGVLGVHTLELQEGVQAADFEKFVIEEYFPALPVSRIDGVTMSLLKGERGDRAGKYLLIFEIDNLVLRDRYFPGHNRPSEEAAVLIAPLRSLAGRWSRFVSASKTDYVELAST